MRTANEGPGADPDTTAVAPSSADGRRVLLVGWDAADWEHMEPLLEAGLMPALQGLMVRGVCGNLSTLQPVISPMLWNSIATGKTAEKHGVLGFIEPHPNGTDGRPWSSTSRTCKAVWNILHQAGRRSNVINWWASHPAEPVRGIVVSDAARHAPGNAEGKCVLGPGTVHPEDLTEFFSHYRMFPGEVESEHLLPFVPRAAEVNQERDRTLHDLAKIFSECVTVQSMATEAMQREAWDFTAVYFEGIDHFCHRFMPYHPPRMETVSEEQYELYKGVIAGAYQFHDMMLERLLALAGPETTVILCSDHGFHSRRRPRLTPREPAGPTLWHREFGIFVAAGPGIRGEGRVFGATLLDITPTILTLFGLPCGADMDGKPLTDALDAAAAPVLPRIGSWEDVEGEAGRHAEGAADARADDDEDVSRKGGESLLRQFAALGYVDERAVGTGKGAEIAVAESRYNLAQVHLACGRAAEAVPLLEELTARYPWETRYLNQWATACVDAGYYQQAREILNAAYPEGTEPPPPLARLVFARACAGLGDRQRALEQISVLAGATANFPNLQAELGHILIDAGRLDLAEVAFRSALQNDPQNAGAHQGLSSVHLRRHEYEAAADSALTALSLIYQQPIAHFNLGAALARMGETDKAREALRRAVEMRPRMLAAWRWLAALESVSGPAGDFLAGACRENARRLSRERAAQAAGRKSRAMELRPLPVIPPPAERRAAMDRERPTQAPPVAPARTFTIVSGLPRSGTSLMMQMLAAAGLLPKTDGERAADEDNPEGYLEWEALKRIAAEPQLLDEPGLDRLAIKCVSALLPKLPAQHRYRVLFMMRPVEEIARSQQRMIERRGTTGMSGSLTDIQETLQRHRDETLTYLRSHPRTFEVLEVDYPSLVAEPETWVERIGAFLGAELVPDPHAMCEAVRPDLHRNRTAAEQKP